MGPGTAGSSPTFGRGRSPGDSWAGLLERSSDWLPGLGGTLADYAEAGAHTGSFQAVTATRPQHLQVSTGPGPSGGKEEGELGDPLGEGERSFLFLFLSFKTLFII